MEHRITRISSIEIPVSNVDASVEWYVNVLGLEVQHKDEKTAMLTFNAVGVPGLFLCETGSSERLRFVNSNNGITHSVVDFYTDDLERCHKDFIAQGVKVGKLNVFNGFGGFGFEDPDGNMLSVCNAVQKGQV